MTRELFIPVRVSHQEHSELNQAAHAAGARGVSTYMRSEALSAARAAREKLTSSLLKELNQTSWQILSDLQEIVDLSDDFPDAFSPTSLEKIDQLSSKLESLVHRLMIKPPKK